MRSGVVIAAFGGFVGVVVAVTFVLGAPTNEPATAEPAPGVTTGSPTADVRPATTSPATTSPATTSPAAAPASDAATPRAATATAPPSVPAHPLVDRSSVGQPWGDVAGLTTFRGNPTRTFYGVGPVPSDPAVLWRYPSAPMCTTEVVGEDETRAWCGTGWTGQPLVREVAGTTEVVFGAYDRRVHFLDGRDGQPTRPSFETGHLVKGTETLDPDGYPLLYTGSRDGRLRIVALDRERPTELWALEAHPRRVWNNDWDGSPAIVGGVLYVGGEDSWFYAVRLDRSFGDDGLVRVDPHVLLEMPGFTDELFAMVGDRNVSIEGSVALYEGRAYFANSGGRVVGLDVGALEDTGEAPVVFDFWAGDDIDATITIDADGMLYVAVELERFLPRARQVGQLVKLDPYTRGDPIVWSVDVPPRSPGDDGGIWSTPALHAGVLYVTTHPGDLLAVDAGTGEVVYRERIGYHEWGSPAVADGVLVVPLCEEGGLRAYDLAEPHRPVEQWTLRLGGCVESTPAIWQGRVYVGSRDGFFYAIGDP